MKAGIGAGIAVKLGLLLALGGLLMVGLTGYFSYAASRDLLVRSTKNELLTSLQVLSRRISVSQQEISRHLQVLAQHPAALAVLKKRDATIQEQAQLATLFKLVMDANPGYFQIRLISARENGMERVRVDRDRDGLLQVTGDDLQEKGHFAYVYDTLKLPAGAVYLSRIGINRERGAHAGLEQPTVQLAMPVADAHGAVHGLVVINVDLKGMFALLAEDLPSEFQLYLANREGDYLIHPDPALTFGFDKGRRVLVQDEFAATRALVEDRAEEVLTEVAAGRHAVKPVVAAFIRRKVAVTSHEGRVILGLAQPLASVLRQTDELDATMLRIVLGLSLASIFVAALLARFITRRTKTD